MISDRQAYAVIPPRKNTQALERQTNKVFERNGLLKIIKDIERVIWKKWAGYHPRILVETKMYFIKLLRVKLTTRNFLSKVKEIHSRVTVLNRFNELSQSHT